MKWIILAVLAGIVILEYAVIAGADESRRRGRK